VTQYAVIWEPRINKGERVAVFESHEDAWLVALKVVPDCNPRVVHAVDLSAELAWAKEQIK
jgi:hypothetical protein